MSTSKRPLVLTSSIIQRQQRFSSITELPITTNSSSNSEQLSSSTVQKPFKNFIAVILAAFTVSSNFSKIVYAKLSLQI
ncbi:unnamed protein product [Cercopithifilaria johnstoni]|uniref:Uncharacterized protein n=1 Tax=Cercopithifilaria johnstoni TaxID=2874296 RepID=A0A8J2M1Q3_9BILA|nr:unnamed protein product [Cercopithifilaria johnstoni]